MGRAEAAGDASPQHQPIDLRLKLAREGQSRGIDSPCLGDASGVLRIAKPGTQTIAKQVEPANFVAWTQLAPVGHLEQSIAEETRGCERPRFTLQSGDRFQFADERSGIDASSSAARGLLNARLMSCTAASCDCCEMDARSMTGRQLPVSAPI